MLALLISSLISGIHFQGYTPKLSAYENPCCTLEERDLQNIELWIRCKEGMSSAYSLAIPSAKASEWYF